MDGRQQQYSTERIRNHTEMILLQSNKTIHCVNHYINSLIYLPKINRIVALITRTNDCNVSVYMTAAKPSGNKINCKNKSCVFAF
jgi:hypothetical protein